MMKILNQNKVELNLNQIKEQHAPKACDFPIPNVRSPSEIMTLTRLGSIFPHRLSFMRIFIRNLIKEKSQIKISRKEFSQKALTFIVTHEKPHQNASIEIHRSGGPFTFVPLADFERKACSSVVWMESNKNIEPHSHASVSGFILDIKRIICY